MKARPRVALAGLFHETHVFLDGTTALDAFERRSGSELLEAAGDGSPLDGVISVARHWGWELLPIVDMRASPSASVEDEVVEEFWATLAAGLDSASREGPIDALFLVLHGAMQSQSHCDVEGLLLQRLAQHLGEPRPLIAGVLDLHANLGPNSVRYADLLVSYRCNPHTDARESAVRAAKLLGELLAEGERPAMLARSADIIWPPTGTGTVDLPMRELEASARRLEAEQPDKLLSLSVLAGFAYGDSPEMGVCMLAVARDTPEGLATAQAALDALCEQAWQLREHGLVVEEDPQVLLDAILPIERGPVVLSEPSDNVGGGAPGDGTGALRALLARDVPSALVVINDPVSVEALSQEEIGAVVELRIGGRGSHFDPGPLPLKVNLISRSDGEFDLEDPNSHLASMVGKRVRMGPCAVVTHRGITILLTSRKTPPFDLGQLRSQGLDPLSFEIIVAKAAVAHRRAYESIAVAQHAVATPGPCPTDLTLLPYRLRPRPAYPLEPKQAARA